MDDLMIMGFQNIIKNVNNESHYEKCAYLFDSSHSTNISEFISKAKVVLYNINSASVRKEEYHLYDGLFNFINFYKIETQVFLQSFIEYLKSLSCNVEHISSIFICIRKIPNNQIDFIVSPPNHNESNPLVQNLLIFLRKESFKNEKFDQVNLKQLSDLAFNLSADVKKYSNQIAGHGIFFEDDFRFLHCQNFVYKPIQDFPKGKTELYFYEKLFGIDQDVNLKELQYLVPRYFGIYCDKSMSDSLIYMGLEDSISMFHQPCVADIKLGQVSYSPDADPEKIANEKFKYYWRETIGFLFTGIKVVKPDGEELFIDRFQGLSFDPDSVFTDGILEFLTGVEDKTALALQIRTQLTHVLDWFNCQRVINLFSASLLIGYESNCPDKVVAKLIDFTHVMWTDTIDNNCIFGLKSLIAYLDQVQ